MAESDDAEYAGPGTRAGVRADLEQEACTQGGDCLSGPDGSAEVSGSGDDDAGDGTGGDKSQVMSRAPTPVRVCERSFTASR